jgi:serine protease Do
MKIFALRPLFVAAALALTAAIGLPMSPSSHARDLPDFVTLYEQNSPSVVSISVSTNFKRGPRPGAATPRKEGEDAQPDREEMEEFFRRYFGGGGGGRQPREPRRQGGGSGFVISVDGFIVTNAHVVEDADEVIVKFTDRRELKAKIIGLDKRTDVALIKVEATGLNAVKIGSPDALRIGEWVAAIGQPLGFETTLTTGVVSAKARGSRGGDSTGDLVPFIQHDAAVNPGNSGGPLFNTKGEVVAINSMIATVSGGFQGISFAVPIDLAMDIVGQLRAGGAIKRGMLGVGIGRVSRDFADAFGLPRAQGALVNSVNKDSAAEKAGIKEGDVILKFNGRSVEESSDLPRYVTAVRPNTPAKVQVWRDGKLLDLDVTLQEFADTTIAAATPERKTAKEAAKPSTTTDERLGLVLRPLTEKERAATGLKSGGVAVASLDGKSAAQALNEGDVIVSVTRKGKNTPVETPAQLVELIKGAEKGTTLAFRVKRASDRTGAEYAEFFAPEKLPE